MKPFRFLHAADLHLDTPFQGLKSLPKSMLRIVREATFNALDRIVELALQERVDFIIVSGDVYDLADRSLRAQLRFQKAVQRLADAGIGTYVVHGNHDPESGYQAILTWPDKVHIFNSDEVSAVPAFSNDGEHLADIYGISYRNSAVTENLAARFQAASTDRFTIAVLHCNVDGRADHDNYAPCKKTDLINAGFDYWALGHIHQRAVLHEQPWIVYPGNSQGRNIKENGARGVYIAHVDEERQVTLHFHETDTVRWLRSELNISGMPSEQSLISALRGKLHALRSAVPQKSVIVQMILSGRGPMHYIVTRGDKLAGLLAEMQSELETDWEMGSAETFIWLTGFQVQTISDAWDKLQLQQEDSFIGDLLRTADMTIRNPEQLQVFMTEALALMLESKYGEKLLGALPAEQWTEWLKEAEERALQLLLEGDRAP